MPQLDHLVYAVPDLDTACAAFAKTTGVTPTLGGVHPGRGTHNALVALEGGAYLELIAPVPEATGPLWMGVHLAHKPTVTRWAVNGVDMASHAAITNAQIAEGKRNTAEGLDLRWRMTIPSAEPLIDVTPFALDWSASVAHPCLGLPAKCRLTKLAIVGPDPTAIQATYKALGITGLAEVREGPTSTIEVTLETPRGTVTLGRRDVMFNDHYLEVNRDAWNIRTAQHLTSDFYDVEGWLAGKSSLTDIESPLLGDISGKRLLHLQCHFGQDTLSFARLGAEVTGLDLSPAAISAAKALAQRADLDATFVEGDVFAAPTLIDGPFDIVFASYGTINWLPDIKRWAAVVAHFLQPSGRLVFAEFHPVTWMLDEKFQELKFPYNSPVPIVETEGTYTDVLAEAPNEMVTWNHGLASVIGALLEQGLYLTHLSEYDYSPYAIYGDRGVEVSPGRHMVKGMQGKLPLVYALVAER